MLKVVFVFALSAFATPLLAADTFVIAPPGKWVLSATDAPEPKLDDDLPVRSLVQDSQIQLDHGFTRMFSRSVLEIRKPEGLAAVSTIALPWRPDTDELTVHWIHILRKGETLDLLAKGQKFTVLRREANLERAMLDGTLTAVIQPEGVQVGDQIDLAYTITRRDAVSGSHDEFLTGELHMMPLELLRMRVSWPKGEAVRFRLGSRLPKPVLATNGQLTTLEYIARGVLPQRTPKGAPPRYSNLSSMEFTDAGSWSDIAGLMRPLYATAATLSPQSPLQAEIRKIAASSTDPLKRAEAALRLVQDQVRYVYLAVGVSGYVPANADTTWARRFGDCKAKSALLVALLHGLQIEATPALVSTQNGDGLDGRLPLMQHFDHVIVQARINGRAYWLDGTRTEDRSPDAVETPGFRWALPLDGAAGLTQLIQAAPDKPQEVRNLKLDASGGLNVPAMASAERIYRGDAAVMIWQGLNVLTAADRDQAIRRFWQQHYNWIKIDKVSFNFDDARREIRLAMEGKGNMGWQTAAGTTRRRYWSNASVIAYRPDFVREEGSDKFAPFAVNFPSYSEDHETVVLPNKGYGFSLAGKDVDQKLAGVAYRRTSSLSNGVVTISVSERSLAPEFSAAEAKRTEVVLGELNDDTVYILAPVTYGRR